MGKTIIAPRHAKMYFRAYANSEGLDQSAHPHSLIRAFPVFLPSHEDYRMYEWRAKVRMILCACIGLSESAPSSAFRRHFFARRCPINAVRACV